MLLVNFAFNNELALIALPRVTCVPRVVSNILELTVKSCTFHISRAVLGIFLKTLLVIVTFFIKLAPSINPGTCFIGSIKVFIN